MKTKLLIVALMLSLAANGFFAWRSGGDRRQIELLKSTNVDLNAKHAGDIAWRAVAEGYMRDDLKQIDSLKDQLAKTTP